MELTEREFFGAGVLGDPVPVYRQFIANAPVHRFPDTGNFLVTSHALVEEALRRVEDFSSAYASLIKGVHQDDPEIVAVMSEAYPTIDMLNTSDPPVHTATRKLVNSLFGLPQVRRIEASIAAQCHGLIDRFIGRGECEFVSEFASQLPTGVIAEFIGFGLARRADMKRWADAFTVRLSRLASREGELEAARTIVESHKAMKALLDERRANPRDDLASALVRLVADDGRALSDAELVSMLSKVVLAGNESSAGGLGNGLVELIRQPAALEAMRNDPAKLPNFIEELLRLGSPAQGLWRLATRDTELGGVAIPKGAKLMVRIGAANRDPQAFDDADAIEPRRENLRKHMALGSGIHVCLGGVLAKREFAVAFGILLERLRDLRFAPGKNDFAVNLSASTRSYQKLYIEFAPA